MNNKNLQEEAAKYHETTHLQVEAISNKINKLAECRPHVCDVCNKGFRFNSGLIAHIRVHTGEKPFHCSYCPRSFNSNSNLNKHEKLHRNERDHKCPFCTKAFVTLWQLNGHIRVHAGLKFFQCPDCSEKYHTSTDVRRHRMGKHGLERPHVCPQNNCDKKYIQRHGLNRHLKSKHGILLPYECSKCDQRFRLHNELLCHEGTHTEGDNSAEEQSTNIQQSSSVLQNPVNKSIPVAAKNQNSTNKSNLDKHHESKKQISKKTVPKNKEDRLFNKNSKLVKVIPKNQIGNKSQNTEKTQKSDDAEEEIILIYEGNQKDETSKECSVNSDMKVKKRKKKRTELEDAENEVSQNKYNHNIDESSEHSEHSKTKKKKKNEIQEIIDIESDNGQLEVDLINENEESIKLKEKVDKVQKPDEEEVIVIFQGNSKEERSKRAAASIIDLVEPKKSKKKRKILEDVTVQITENQNREIDGEISDCSHIKKKKKKDKEQIIEVENQDSKIEDNNYEILLCSCGKDFSSSTSAKFKRHRKRRGHHRPRIHICPYCVDVSFKTYRRFESHFNKVHGNNIEEEEEKDSVYESDDSVYDYDDDDDVPLIHECFLCQPEFRGFPDFEALQRHYDRIHK